MCWVDWIHDTQIWIETTFCKYHQEETKMCNGCSTVTCQCKPQRIPKVGEVWVGITDKDKRVVEAVTSKSVYYTLGSMPYGKLLQDFVQYNDPPKPKPREVWINCDRPYEGFHFKTENETRAYWGAGQNIKLFREVLD